MAFVIGIFFAVMWIWSLWHAPGFTIAVTIIILVVVTCIGVNSETTIEEVFEEVTETQTETEPAQIVTDSVQEQCIDGILYLLVIKEGEKFFGAKENRYGDNERCFETGEEAGPIQLRP